MIRSLRWNKKSIGDFFDFVENMSENNNKMNQSPMSRQYISEGDKTIHACINLLGGTYDNGRNRKYCIRLWGRPL